MSQYKTLETYEYDGMCWVSFISQLQKIIIYIYIYNAFKCHHVLILRIPFL